MKRSRTVIFLALVLWGGIFFMSACDGGNGTEDGDQTPTPSAPNAPTIEDIYSENRELAILWDVVNNADTYNLYWNSTGGVSTSDNSVTGLLAPYYVHTGLSLFKTYSYAVTAVNAGGASGLSNEMSALAAGVPEELWKRMASDAQDSDNLGYSVAVSGDYAVAGARGEDGVGGTNRGAAYVFERNYMGNDNWGEVATLTAGSDTEDFAYFGNSVAIDGDYVVVGADSEDSGGIDSGAVYVFGRNQGGPDAWGQVAKLTASDAEAGDKFGWSVAISGDYVVVGAYLEDGLTGTDLGAVYVFGRNQGGPDVWGQVAKLTASDAENGDEFGNSVAISGDNVVVGALYEDGVAGTNYGAAYVFNRNSPSADDWGEVTKLTAGLDVENAAYFGASVAVSGDYALVGARGEDGGAGVNRGAVYIFDRNYPGTDDWGEVAKLIASDAEDGDEFGSSVAIDGDYVIVGAHYEDGAGTSQGAAYIYYRNQGLTDSWGEVIKLMASDAEDQDWFGYSVAISGDYAVVGSPNYEGGTGTDRGAVYIF
jgi:hypothetical protein